jgi:hypothetical protein
MVSSLGSLLSIFLVECSFHFLTSSPPHSKLSLADISTSYVDRLHGAAHSHSHSHSPDTYVESFGHSHSHSHVPADILSHASPDLTPAPSKPSTASSSLVRNSVTPVSYSAIPTPTPAATRPRPASHEPSSYFTGHHRHEERCAHDGHGRVLPRATPGGLESFYGSKPRTISTETRLRTREEDLVEEDETDLEATLNGHSHSQSVDRKDDLDAGLSRKRQIVSILVSSV